MEFAKVEGEKAVSDMDPLLNLTCDPSQIQLVISSLNRFQGTSKTLPHGMRPYWWHHVQSLTPETTSMANPAEGMAEGMPKGLIIV